MQITTLNKIITLFLTGIFLLVVIFFGLYERLQNTGMFQQSGLAALAGSPALLLFITVGLLSTALLLGLIVDSLAELTTDRFLRRTKEWPFIMRVLMLKDDADRYLHYRNIIVKKYESLRKDEEDKRDRCRCTGRWSAGRR